jgi:hypothetical protein
MQPLFSPKIVLLCLISFIMAFFISNRLFRGDPAGWKQIISSDGRGYYAYLPALLIDHDLSYKKVIEREKKILGFPDYQPSYLVKVGNSSVNKYFAGEALLLLPFFLLAMICSFVAGLDINGYSFFFQLFTGLGAIFYLFIGLLYLQKILHYLTVRASVIAFVIITILLGTNLLYYAVWQPSMSHVYSFFAINGFLWYTSKSISYFTRRNAVFAGFFLGLVLLIRPTNGVALLLVPFLFRDFAELKLFIRSLWRWKSSVLILMLVTSLVFSIQLILWYFQTGHFFLWSYQDEGFYFKHPEVMNVLFSFRKGLFVYTPLILIAGLGLLAIIRKPVKFISMLTFLAVSTYIIASWWNWYYGNSFGLRAFIDYYGIYGILIALLINRFSFKGDKLVMAILFLPFIVLNLFQTWQYSNWIIHPYSMNKEKYEYVFLKSDSTYFNCLGGNEELPGYSVDRLHPCLSTKNTFEKTEENWDYGFIQNYSNAISGTRVNFIDSLHLYSSGYMNSADKISKIPATYYIEASMMVFDSIPGASNNAILVFSMDSINFRENYWQGIHLNDIPLNPSRTWRKCKFSWTLPRILNPKGIIKIYVWNTGKKVFMIDDFQLTFYIDKPAGRKD